MLTLEARDLCKSYAGRRVLKDINLRVSTGEILAIAGPNGSGKSTLLKILLGLVQPTSGSVLVSEGERSLALVNRFALSAVVTPYFEIYDTLSAAENFRFYNSLRGKSASDSDIDSSLTSFGLSGRSADRVSSYSSGMRQRLKLAIALSVEPALLFLDEPSSNLDESGKVIMIEAVTAVKSKKVVIWATNDPDEAQRADKVISLG